MRKTSRLKIPGMSDMRRESPFSSLYYDFFEEEGFFLGRLSRPVPIRVSFLRDRRKLKMKKGTKATMKAQ